MSMQVEWNEAGSPRHARWQSEAALPVPAEIRVVDDTLTAAEAWRLLQQDVGLLWRGDWQNARNLLQAVSRRAERQLDRPGKAPATPQEAFQQHRQRQGRRARALARLLIEIGPDLRIQARRGQDVADALRDVHDQDGGACLLAIRELLALVSAHEWRKKGVLVPALGERIHAHYGVFSPLRGEYLDLIAQAPLPATTRAFDIGTGTGVIAALLARRGIGEIIATDNAPRALACAADNLARLGLAQQVRVEAADLFPQGCAELIVCNPPWLPETPSSPVEAAVYDPGSRMLRGFLAALPAHLAPAGEGWLILSDIAELLGLRSRDELLSWIADAGLEILGRLDIRPRHPKANDPTDPLHAARAREITSLWRLGRR